MASHGCPRKATSRTGASSSSTRSGTSTPTLPGACPREGRGADRARQATPVRGRRPDIQAHLRRAAREGHEPDCRRTPARPGESDAPSCFKPKHPWTNGQFERMNRTIKDARIKRFHYEAHDQLRSHLADLMDIYNYARRLKTLKGLTPGRFEADSCGGFQVGSDVIHDGEQVRFVMAMPIPLRSDFDGSQVRALALRAKDGGVAHRLWPSEIYDGGSRSDAARIGGVGLQAVRDWVLRFNAKGRRRRGMARLPVKHPG